MAGVREYTLFQVLKKLREDYKTAKLQFGSQYNILSEYYFQVRKGAEELVPMLNQGQFLNDGSITDNIGMKVAKDMAAAITGMTWKADGGTFRLKPSRFIQVTEATKQYYNRINQDITYYMERRDANFETSYATTTLGNVVYGTSGLSVFRGDYTTPIRFQSRSVIQFYLGYNGDGEVDTVIIDYYRSAKELYAKYEEKAGRKVLEALNSGDFNRRFLVSEVIEPRPVPKAKKGVLSMPYASYLFMPYDGADDLLEEGGYLSIPMKVLFFEKLDYEDYGRSPAMDALPSVQQANVAAEILAVGGEQTAQPAMGMFDNGSLAGKRVDLSAGALNVFNVTGTLPTERPMFQLYTVGDLRVMYDWWVRLHQSIAEHFKLDKLFGLLQDQGPQKTLGQVMIQDRIRSDAIAPLNNQHTRFLSDVIDRQVEILFDMGLLGVANPEDEQDAKVSTLKQNGHVPFAIPSDVLQAMLAGREWYELEFISPAARIMKSDELQSALSYIQTIGQLGSLSQEFLDTIDPDGTSMKLKELFSADMVMNRTPQQVAEIRDTRQRMQMEMAQLEAARVQSQTNQSNAQAMAAQSGAMVNVQQTGGMA